jgi:flagellin
MHTAGSGYKAGDVLSIAAVNASAGTVQAPTITNTVAGVLNTSAEVQTVTFNAASMAAGDSITLAGLTFTANQAVTTSEAVDAFKALTAGATTGGLTAKGVYSGTLTGFNTGAGATPALTFTSTTLADVAAVGITVRAGGTQAMAEITNIVVGKDLSSLSTTNRTLTMSGTINGLATTQSLAVSNNAALATQTFNFTSFGAQFDIKSYQAQSASQIGTAIATLNGLGGTASFGNPGQLIVSQGNNSALKFQSGANSDAFIQVDTLNVQTASSGAYAGTASEMMTLGTRISQSGTGNLGTLGSLDTIDTWQTAFKNAAAAVDSALEYVSTQRSVYGSQMNRLSYVSTNLQAQSTNIQNSRSAIIDTDFAAETARLTKGQIMQQAATAMLAQANQMPNVILSLLK